MSSATITIHMKRGGMMKVEAEGHVYNDSNGAGERWTACDDFRCFFPDKKKSRKARPVPSHIFDEGRAIESFIAVLEDNARDPY